MTVKIFNSLTRQKEEFVPLDPSNVTFYSCGPTVYGEFHIGNARSFVAADVIRRWLLESGYKVTYAQNITDVDDKIIARAEAEGTTPEAIAENFTKYFFDKIQLLGNLPADHYPRATAHIGPMIGLIRKLMDRGHAYPSDDGSVWFEVASFPEYGKLSRMPLDQMRQGERVDEVQQARKRSPLDFALWKAAKPGEPAWKAPWGQGRPGWHLECSCMSMKVLGSETIDIHSGGADLRFPHHENEIAQSEAATGKPFARYWIHNGMLDIDGEKMSKSLGNIRTIDDVFNIADPLTIRYFLISARYRDKLDFNEATLHACASAVERLVNSLREARRHSISPATDWLEDEELAAHWNSFKEGMDDDFNTPIAIAELARTVTLLNTRLTALQNGGGQQPIARAMGLLHHMRHVLGLTEELEQPDQHIDEATAGKLQAIAMEFGLKGDDPSALVEALIEHRAAARRGKDFATSDKIRDGMTSLGIVLEDKPGGVTTWRLG
ncbi:MAG: cysteine--tRNA ligase [Candidatus Sumerlaeia bacterium]|nr:cysteine--tRNA ligase [Candidatus Sumerlaeia bacterium]